MRTTAMERALAMVVVVTSSIAVILGVQNLLHECPEPPEHTCPEPEVVINVDRLAVPVENLSAAEMLLNAQSFQVRQR